MEKVRLTVDELQVQSFTTSDEQSPGRGTVHAHDAPTDEVECPTAHAQWETCWNTCPGPGGGNTDDCTWMCYTDGCSAADCSNGCDWSTISWC